MAAPQHTVWTWHDSKGVIRFVGYGKFTDVHPAIARFEKRFDSDADLDTWLQSLDTEPQRGAFGDHIVSQPEAVGYALGLRAKYAETLLTSRGASTYSGGHPARGVFRFCEADITKSAAYDSVRKAAAAMGCNPSTVSRWCNNPKNTVWGFIDGKVVT